MPRPAELHLWLHSRMLAAPPIVLTIAGFDPSSGAGVTADVKTIAAHGCYGVAAITALTVQSTAGVRASIPVEPSLLLDSLNELAADVKVSAVHIGMLGNGKVAAVVADFLRNIRLPHIVLDPVLRSSSGTSLVDQDGAKVILEGLIPLAEVVTPNVDEASELTGLPVGGPEQMKLAADRLHEYGARAVVITGGHLDPAVDVLSVPGGAIQMFRADRLECANTHGTGCAFSTALACQLALGQALQTAVLLAKAYVLNAIRNSYAIGRGAGPVNHLFGHRKG
jgi:hydroxymethylpyrimidine/phosphomethylpyrimidine kinase